MRRFLSDVLLVTGALLLMDAGLTVIWEEPVSAVYTSRAQSELSGEIERLERSERERERTRGGSRDRGGRRERHQARRAGERAKELRSFVDDGDALGQLTIDKLQVREVVVSGSSLDNLRRGPAHYTETGLPGERRTVGIAGHRTTYSAPFREVDELDRGDEIQLRMPYGRFSYAVEKTEIVQPERVDVLESKGYDRLVLTACHPLYSAAQRIVVFARMRQLRQAGLAGAENDDEYYGPPAGVNLGKGPEGLTMVLVLLGFIGALVGAGASVAGLAAAGAGSATAGNLVLSLVASLAAAAGLVLVLLGVLG